MKEGTISTFVMINGAEIIGRFVEETNNTVIVEKPRMVQVTQNGVGLVNGICMTGKEPKGKFTFPKKSILYIVETADELASGWTQQTTGIVMPQKGVV